MVRSYTALNHPKVNGDSAIDMKVIEVKYNARTLLDAPDFPNKSEQPPDIINYVGVQFPTITLRGVIDITADTTASSAAPLHLRWMDSITVSDSIGFLTDDALEDFGDTVWVRPHHFQFTRDNNTEKDDGTGIQRGYLLNYTWTFRRTKDSTG